MHYKFVTSLHEHYTYILTYMHTYIYTYVHAYIHTYMHTYLHIYICTYIYTYIHIYLHTYIYTYIHTYIHTYTLTYIHTYIHIHLHTYIHTYIHRRSYETLVIVYQTTWCHIAKHCDLLTTYFHRESCLQASLLDLVEIRFESRLEHVTVFPWFVVVPAGKYWYSTRRYLICHLASTLQPGFRVTSGSSALVATPVGLESGSTRFLMHCCYY